MSCNHARNALFGSFSIRHIVKKVLKNSASTMHFWRVPENGQSEDEFFVLSKFFGFFSKPRSECWKMIVTIMNLSTYKKTNS